MIVGGVDQPVKGLYRVIFEKGVETQLDDKGLWYFQSVRDGNPVRWTPSIEGSQFGLRPLLLVYDTPQGLQEDLLSPNNSASLDLYFNVETILLPKSLAVEHFHDFIYAFGALTYHCKQLAYIYCEIAKGFAQSKARFEGEDKGESFAVVHDCNVFYEFDALITATIRCYSMIRIVLWSIYCSGLGSRPANFRNFLSKSTSRLPQRLHERLQVSWNDWGNRANDYRDFIQHYSTLTETGWPLPKSRRLENNIWCISVVLPDNPERKSREAFVFDKNTDALSYGWELTGQMENVFLDVAHSLSVR